MYSSMKEFLERIVSKGDDAIAIHVDDKKLAAAALLYHVIRVDGRVRPEEVARFREIVQQYLEVSDDEINQFQTLVEETISNSIALTDFTGQLRSLPIEEKRKILDYMSEISLSDQELHEFELNMVARVADLLDLSDHKVGKT